MIVLTLDSININPTPPHLSASLVYKHKYTQSGVCCNTLLMIDDISTVLNPSYHVAKSLVILEEIIRVALVGVVFFLGPAG